MLKNVQNHPSRRSALQLLGSFLFTPQVDIWEILDSVSLPWEQSRSIFDLIPKQSFTPESNLVWRICEEIREDSWFIERVNSTYGLPRIESNSVNSITSWLESIYEHWRQWELVKYDKLFQKLPNWLLHYFQPSASNVSFEEDELMWYLKDIGSASFEWCFDSYNLEFRIPIKNTNALRITLIEESCENENFVIFWELLDIFWEKIKDFEEIDMSYPISDIWELFDEGIYNFLKRLDPSNSIWKYLDISDNNLWGESIDSHSSRYDFSENVKTSLYSTTSPIALETGFNNRREDITRGVRNGLFSILN